MSERKRDKHNDVGMCNMGLYTEDDEEIVNFLKLLLCSFFSLEMLSQNSASD